MKIYLFTLLYLVATQMAPFIHIHVHQDLNETRMHLSIHPPEQNNVSNYTQPAQDHHSTNKGHEPDDVHFEGDQFYPPAMDFSLADIADNFNHEIVDIVSDPLIGTGRMVLLPQKIPDFFLSGNIPSRAPPISA